MNDLEKKDPWPLFTNPFVEILTKEGVELELLAKKLKEELNYTDKEKPTPAAMNIRQKARMDAQSIFDVYPVEKKAGNTFGDVHIQIINYGEQKKEEIER